MASSALLSIVALLACASLSLAASGLRGSHLVAGSSSSSVKSEYTYPSYPGGPDSPGDSDQPAWPGGPGYPGGPSYAPAPSSDTGVAGRAWALMAQLFDSAVAALKQEATAPGAKTSGDDDDDDDDKAVELPFSSGSTVVLSDPSLDADELDCDVTSTSPWVASAADSAAASVFNLFRKKAKGGDKPTADSPFVYCDHEQAASAQSFWKTGGFMVLGDYAKFGGLKEGDSVDLRSQGSFKYCAAWKSDKHVVSCDESDKGDYSKFEFYLVSEHKARAALRAVSKGKKSEPSPDQVAVYVKHTASDAYCAADLYYKHAPLTCKYDLKDAPVVWLKVHKPYPYPGGPGAAPRGAK